MTLSAVGDDMYCADNFAMAIKKYQCALRMSEPFVRGLRRPYQHIHLKSMYTIRFRTRLNLSAAHLKLRQWNDAAGWAESVVTVIQDSHLDDIDTTHEDYVPYTTAWYRRWLASLMEGEESLMQCLIAFRLEIISRDYGPEGGEMDVISRYLFGNHRLDCLTLDNEALIDLVKSQVQHGDLQKVLDSIHIIGEDCFRYC